ncbi:MAG TPA: NifU family protein [Tenericutes bacterium]|nr:NifU family protein [Mycoplasmatota bacterium]
MNEKEQIIIGIIEQLRPFLISDGGDVKFVKYEDNIVYIQLMGACSHCHMMDITLKDMIETSIIQEVPEVKKVVNISN